MTEKEILEIVAAGNESARLDREAAAEVLKWAEVKICHGIAYVYWNGSIEDSDFVSWDTDWHPTSNLAQAHTVEDEIREQGLESLYVLQMMRVLPDCETWDMVHAAPVYRVAAACLAVMENKRRRENGQS